ncbi:MAG: hypothetical protein ACOYJX_01070 [Acutalibacteraceae bacterium]|jgi:hypothetical protein
MLKKIEIFELITLCAVLILSATGCASKDNSQNTEISNSLFTSIENVEAKEWQNAYSEFLKEFSLSNNKVASFALRDLDGSGVPELIIIQEDENALNSVLTAYSYDGNVNKIGDFANESTSFAEGFRLSKKTMFPGLFESWHGGGVEHYGYLSLKDGKLIHEDLWYCDRTKEPPHQEVISEDKQLVNESIEAYPPYDYSDNLLETHLISNNNFDETIMKTVANNN